MADEKAESKSVSISGLVRVLLDGRYDKAVADAITRHAKERDHDSDGQDKKPRGLDSIPAKFLDRHRRDGDKKQRLWFSTSWEALVFFRNLLDLESVLPPKLTSEVLKGQHLKDPASVRRQLASARDMVAVKHAVYSDWLADWPKLEQRLFDDRFDPTTQPLLRAGNGPSRATKAHESTSFVARSLSLHVIKQLDAIDQRVGRDLDEASAAALKTLQLLQLGEVDLAISTIDVALLVAPDHALANFAFAMAFLGKAAKASQDARYFELMQQEANLEHEVHWEHEVENAVGTMMSSRRTALERLARALSHWPSSTSGSHRFWSDHQERSRALSATIQLAFEFAHEHAGGDLFNVLKLNARRQGQKVDAYFDTPGLDEAVLAAALEVERYQPVEMRTSPIQTKTMLLQIYFALAPEQYERYLPLWVKEFKSSPPHALQPLLAPGWQGRAVWANVVRDHLRRGVSTEGLAQLLAEIEVGEIEAMRAFHAEVGAFMTKGSSEEAESDDFDEW